MYSIATDIQLYESLRAKLGKDDADLYVNFIITKVKTATDENLKMFATKEDISNLEKDIRSTEAVLKDDIRNTEARLKDDIRDTEARLKEDIRNTEKSLRDEIRITEKSLREEIRITEKSLREDIRNTEKSLRQDIKNVEIKVKELEVVTQTEFKTFSMLISNKTSETNRWMLGILLSIVLMFLSGFFRK